MYGSTALERCMPASEEWDLHEQYPLIRWQDVLRVSITIGEYYFTHVLALLTHICLIFVRRASHHDSFHASSLIGSMIAYAEGLLPLWTVPVVMLLGVCMFPGQVGLVFQSFSYGLLVLHAEAPRAGSNLNNSSFSPPFRCTVTLLSFQCKTNVWSLQAMFLSSTQQWDGRTWRDHAFSLVS